jgi:hypothetical protein
MDLGRRARFRDLKPDLAGFFLRAVHAAQTDMLPSQSSGKLIAAGRTFFHDGAVELPFREVTGGAQNLQRSRLRGRASDADGNRDRERLQQLLHKISHRGSRIAG